MDAETRKTLEALADHHDERAGSWRERLALAKTQKDVDALTKEAASHAAAAAAIRAALAEVDALTAHDGERFLLWRGLDHPDDACDKCGGAGNRAYGSTAGWRGGIGGQAITTDVCDACWGSGNKSRPGANLRKIEGETRSLRSQVADLTATLDGAVDLRKSIEREREEARYQVDALTQQVADLEARAIPKAWVDNARTLTLEIEHHNFTGRRIQYFKPRGAELCSVTDVGDHHEPIDFPTLSAALSAAKEAT